VPSPQGRIAASPSSEDHQVAVKRPAGGEEGSPGLPCDAESPATKRPRRRKLRKKETVNEDKRWEAARHDARLWVLLTDSSGGESADEYSRFAESGRWIAEMTGSRDRELREQEGDKRMEM
jgi:hypothetical protein